MFSSDVSRMIAAEMPTAASTDCGETSVRRCRRPKARGSCPCSPSEYASRPKPEIERGRREEQDERARKADVDPQRHVQPAGKVLVQRRDDAHQRGAAPLRSERGRPVARRKRHQSDDGDAHVHDDDRADAGEEALRKLHARACASPRRGSRRSRDRCTRASRAAARRRSGARTARRRARRLGSARPATTGRRARAPRGAPA